MCLERSLRLGAHAVLLLDRAGGHTTSKLDVPDNITPIFLPSRAPELNPVENVWQYLRPNWLSNTVFENYDAIIMPHATGRPSVSRYDLWYKRLPPAEVPHSVAVGWRVPRCAGRRPNQPYC